MLKKSENLALQKKITENYTPYRPKGRGLIALGVAGLGIGGLQQAVISRVRDEEGYLPSKDDPVRNRLLARMEQTGTKLLSSKDLAGNNTTLKHKLDNKEGAFYNSKRNGIFLGKNFKNNGVLAHEMGHSEDPTWLTKLNPTGKAMNLWGTAAAAMAPKKFAKLGLGVSALGNSGTVASEISASARGYKILEEAGAEGNGAKMDAFKGLPTYLLNAAIPFATYKGRKLMGSFKP